MRRELARKKLISCAFSLPPRCPQAGIGGVPSIFPASREFGISETSSQLTLPSSSESIANLPSLSSAVLLRPLFGRILALVPRRRHQIPPLPGVLGLARAGPASPTNDTA